MGDVFLNPGFLPSPPHFNGQMSLIVQFLLQIVLPAILLLDLFRRDYRQRRDWVVDVVLVAVLLLIVLQIARWDLFSYYLRILLLPAFGLVAFVAFRCIDRKKKKEAAPLEVKDYVAYGVKGLIILAATVMNVSLLMASFAPADAVSLSYPLRGGVYYVGGGGGSRWINNHQAFASQSYAMDIVRLNVFGNRARRLNSEIVEKYAIYGDRVYAPCSGKVIIAEDGHPDNVPPERNEAALAGNHVMVMCDGVKVLLAHLKKGSVAVEVGDDVDDGVSLGEVGNSGNSTQPHLHIHAERGGDPEKILDGQGVPILFDGRFFVRNSVFAGRAPTGN